MARLAYLGTPALAIDPLAGLLEAGHEIALVVSGSDARRGRGAGRSPSPVKAFALERGLEVTDELGALAELALDLAVVVAYGQLIPASLLNVVPMLNLHFSLLPRWRGAAPVERAILAGDQQTGVCVMGLEPTLDTGPIYASAAVEIDDKDLEGLRAELVAKGTALLVELLGRPQLPAPTPQEGEASYAAKLTPGELELDLDGRAVEQARMIRLGRAFTWLDGRRLRILRAVQGDETLEPGVLEGCRLGVGEGSLELLEVQPEGRRPMSAEDWRRGLAVRGALRLGRSSSPGEVVDL